MPLIKRTDLPALLKKTAAGEFGQLYLFFGERYLCREAAESLEKTLLALDAGGTVHQIDGDTEDTGKTLGQLMNFSLLPGLQIHKVTDSRLFHSKNSAASIWEKVEQAHTDNKENACRRHLLAFLNLAGLSAEESLQAVERGQWQEQFGFSRPSGSLLWADELLSGVSGQQKTGTADAASRFQEVFTKGIPPGNILLLSAETVDKRKKFFTFIKKNGVAVDCSVASGGSAAAQKGKKDILRELVMKSLAAYKKKMQPRVLEQLYERVGFHPVAVVMETEKLCLFAGERDEITHEDLDEMVGRTREDALYELTDAFGKKQTARTIILLHRLLENGVHALAILATMKNYLRKLLIFRSLQLQSEPRYQPGMSAQQFQGNYLPALKEREEWKDLLKGHPYALFMSFSKAGEYSCSQLKNWLYLLLQAEFRLKGAPLPPELVLEELFLSMLFGRK